MREYYFEKGICSNPDRELLIDKKSLKVLLLMAYSEELGCWVYGFSIKEGQKESFRAAHEKRSIEGEKDRVFAWSKAIEKIVEVMKDMMPDSIKPNLLSDGIRILEATRTQLKLF